MPNTMAKSPDQAAHPNRAFPANPRLDPAARGLNVLRSIWQHTAEPPVGKTMLIARRLGFTPEPNLPCCTRNNLTYADFEKLINEVYDLTDGRSVFVDLPVDLSPSSVYFFGNLRPPISHTEPITTLWIDDDMKQWQQELYDTKPDCVVSTAATTPLTQLLLDIYGKHTMHEITGKPGTAIFCKE
jgi:hypothetical protein